MYTCLHIYIYMYYIWILFIDDMLYFYFMNYNGKLMREIPLLRMGLTHIGVGSTSRTILIYQTTLILLHSQDCLRTFTILTYDSYVHWTQLPSVHGTMDEHLLQDR